LENTIHPRVEFSSAYGTFSNTGYMANIKQVSTNLKFEIIKSIFPYCNGIYSEINFLKNQKTSKYSQIKTYKIES
jgi:hypothetical protein